MSAKRERLKHLTFCKPFTRIKFDGETPRLSDLPQAEANKILTSQWSAEATLEKKKVGYNRSRSHLGGSEKFDAKEFTVLRGYLPAMFDDIAAAVENNDYGFFVKLGKKCEGILERRDKEPDPIGRFITRHWVIRTGNVPSFCFLSRQVLFEVCSACVLTGEKEKLKKRLIDDRIDELKLVQASRKKIGFCGWHTIIGSGLLHLAFEVAAFNSRAYELGRVPKLIC